MTANDDFEAGINEILEANDIHGKPNKVISEENKHIKEETPPKLLFHHDNKQFPTWITFIVRLVAGITFIVLLIKYANNIAFR